jgi:hypothetical protein
MSRDNEQAQNARDIDRQRTLSWKFETVVSGRSSVIDKKKKIALLHEGTLQNDGGNSVGDALPRLRPAPQD